MADRDDRELPRPPITPEAAPYWEAARQGRLLLQRCRACGAVRFYPRLLCPTCSSDDAEWVEASGRGRVHSFTVIHRPPAPAFAGRVPYVVALIDLDEGPRMMANIVGEGARGVHIDDAVQATFEQRGEGVVVPQFMRLMPQ
jgi:uncharacterized OB-fold protein